jgi:hypothetical protein
LGYGFCSHCLLNTCKLINWIFSFLVMLNGSAIA